MQEQFTIHFSEKLTRCQKIILLLRDYPQLRNSYDLIIEKYYATYNDEVKPVTLERDIRMVQYDIGIYPPSDRVKRLRKEAQEKIISYKIEKTWIWSTIKNFFK